MIERELTVSNRLGLHARATAKLVQLLSAYRCNVTLTAKGREVNAKSIMGVMLLAAGQGTPVRRVSALTLPLLLRVLNYAELGLDELPAVAAAGARNGVLHDDG